MSPDLNPMVAGLIITGIGMGLVFVVIVLLWGFMALLVNLTSRIKTGEEAEAEPEAAEAPAAAAADDEAHLLRQRAAAAAVAAVIPGNLSQRKQRAAAAAVMAALVLQKQSAGTASPAASVSQWQAAGRARVFSARSHRYSRKNTRRDDETDPKNRQRTLRR